MFAIIRTRWQTRPLSRRAKRRSSATPGSLRKKYAGIVHPPNMVRLPNHSTISGDDRKPVLEAAVTGLEPGKPYLLALATEPSGTGVLEPLQSFMTNPAGAAVVNAIGPIRQSV